MATLDDAVTALNAATTATTALTQAVNVKKAALDTAVAKTGADRVATGGDRDRTSADRLQTEIDRTTASAARGDAVAARDIVAALAGAKVFATKAAAQGGLATIAADGFALVENDETAGSMRTLYQKVAGALVFVRNLEDFRLTMSLLENRYGIRDLDDFLLGYGRDEFANRPTLNSLFSIVAQGDSVAGIFGNLLFQWMTTNGWKEGGRQFGTSYLTGPVITTGTFAYRGDLTGSVLDQSSLEGQWNFKYLRNAGHIEMDDGATYEMDCGQANVFDQVGVWFARGVPGSGVCQVDVINRDSGAIIATTTTAELASGNLDRVRTIVNLAATPKVRVRLTAIGGKVIFLAMFLLRSTGGLVLCRLGDIGGSTLTQQNYASQTIFAGMCADLGTKAFILHCKEEQGGALFAPTMAKLAAVPGTSIMSIGSFPDSRAEAVQVAANNLQRAAALAYPTRACYFDGYRACISFAECQRLGWFVAGESTHPKQMQYRYILSALIAELRLSAMPRAHMSLPVDTTTVTAEKFVVRTPNTSNGLDAASVGSALPAVSPNIEFAEAWGGSENTKAILKLIRNIWFGARAAAGAPMLTTFGPALSILNGDGSDTSAVRTGGLIITNDTAINNIAGVTRFARPIGLANYTFATRPSGGNGYMIFITDGRQPGEAAGAGTGVLAAFFPFKGWRDSLGNPITV